MNRAKLLQGMQLTGVSLRNTRQRAGAALMGSLLASSAGSACGDANQTAVPGGGVTPELAASTERRAICPGCVRPDVAGNETSDFSGQYPSCTGDVAPQPPGAPGIEQLSRLREAYAGPLELSLRWESGRSFDLATSVHVQSAPTGYSPETRVNVDVVLGDTLFVAGRPASIHEDVECPDWFYVPATVSLSTADGALDVVAEGGFAVGDPGVSERLHAVANLADAAGTLDLKLDPDQPRRGMVHIAIQAWNEVKRGTLDLQLSSPGAPGDEYAFPNTEYPLAGTFPDDRLQ